MKEEYGSGDIINKTKISRVVILVCKLHVDLFYNPTTYH